MSRVSREKAAQEAFDKQFIKKKERTIEQMANELGPEAKAALGLGAAESKLAATAEQSASGANFGAPNCHYCHELISGDYKKVGELCFHPDCWLCRNCNKKLPNAAAKHNNQYYCISCAQSKQWGEWKTGIDKDLKDVLPGPVSLMRLEEVQGQLMSVASAANGPAVEGAAQQFAMGVWNFGQWIKAVMLNEPERQVREQTLTQIEKYFAECNIFIMGMENLAWHFDEKFASESIELSTTLKASSRALLDTVQRRKPCEKCWKPEATKRCSRCSASRYCNDQCFKSAWPQHKKTCRPKQ